MVVSGFLSLVFLQDLPLCDGVTATNLKDGVLDFDVGVLATAEILPFSGVFSCVFFNIDFGVLASIANKNNAIHFWLIVHVPANIKLEKTQDQNPELRWRLFNN